MDNKNYTATILVDQDPATAFNAIKNFRAWWSEEIEGSTDRLNEVFSTTIKTFIYVRSGLSRLFLMKN